MTSAQLGFRELLEEPIDWIDNPLSCWKLQLQFAGSEDGLMRVNFILFATEALSVAVSVSLHCSPVGLRARFLDLLSIVAGSSTEVCCVDRELMLSWTRSTRDAFCSLLASGKAMSSGGAKARCGERGCSVVPMDAALSSIATGRYYPRQEATDEDGNGGGLVSIRANVSEGQVECGE
jgi:hypothetical protein